jgi:hypothetical protein
MVIKKRVANADRRTGRVNEQGGELSDRRASPGIQPLREATARVL